MENPLAIWKAKAKLSIERKQSGTDSNGSLPVKKSNGQTATGKKASAAGYSQRALSEETPEEPSDNTTLAPLTDAHLQRIQEDPTSLKTDDPLFRHPVTYEKVMVIPLTLEDAEVREKLKKKILVSRLRRIGELQRSSKGEVGRAFRKHIQQETKKEKKTDYDPEKQARKVQAAHRDCYQFLNPTTYSKGSDAFADLLLEAEPEVLRTSLASTQKKLMDSLISTELYVKAVKIVEDLMIFKLQSRPIRDHISYFDYLLDLPKNDMKTKIEEFETNVDENEFNELKTALDIYKMIIPQLIDSVKQGNAGRSLKRVVKDIATLHRTVNANLTLIHALRFFIRDNASDLPVAKASDAAFLELLQNADIRSCLEHAISAQGVRSAAGRCVLAWNQANLRIYKRGRLIEDHQPWRRKVVHVEVSDDHLQYLAFESNKLQLWSDRERDAQEFLTFLTAEKNDNKTANTVIPDKSLIEASERDCHDYLRLAPMQKAKSSELRILLDERKARAFIAQALKVTLLQRLSSSTFDDMEKLLIPMMGLVFVDRPIHEHLPVFESIVHHLEHRDYMCALKEYKDFFKRVSKDEKKALEIFWLDFKPSVPEWDQQDFTDLRIPRWHRTERLRFIHAFVRLWETIASNRALVDAVKSMAEQESDNSRVANLKEFEEKSKPTECLKALGKREDLRKHFAREIIRFGVHSRAGRVLLAWRAKVNLRLYAEGKLIEDHCQEAVNNVAHVAVDVKTGRFHILEFDEDRLAGSSKASYSPTTNCLQQLDLLPCSTHEICVNCGNKTTHLHHSKTGFATKIKRLKRKFKDLNEDSLNLFFEAFPQHAELFINSLLSIFNVDGCHIDAEELKFLVEVGIRTCSKGQSISPWLLPLLFFANSQSEWVDAFLLLHAENVLGHRIVRAAEFRQRSRRIADNDVKFKIARRLKASMDLKKLFRLLDNEKYGGDFRGRAGTGELEFIDAVNSASDDEDWPDSNELEDSLRSQKVLKRDKKKTVKAIANVLTALVGQGVHLTVTDEDGRITTGTVNIKDKELQEINIEEKKQETIHQDEVWFETLSEHVPQLKTIFGTSKDFSKLLEELLARDKDNSSEVDSSSVNYALSSEVDKHYEVLLDEARYNFAVANKKALLLRDGLMSSLKASHFTQADVETVLKGDRGPIRTARRLNKVTAEEAKSYKSLLKTVLESNQVEDATSSHYKEISTLNNGEELQECPQKDNPDEELLKRIMSSLTAGEQEDSEFGGSLVFSINDRSSSTRTLYVTSTASGRTAISGREEAMLRNQNLTEEDKEGVMKSLLTRGELTVQKKEELGSRIRQWHGEDLKRAGFEQIQFVSAEATDLAVAIATLEFEAGKLDQNTIFPEHGLLVARRVAKQKNADIAALVQSRPRCRKCSPPRYEAETKTDYEETVEFLKNFRASGEIRIRNLGLQVL